jgi:YVTN family beta-propeller protein
MKLTTANVHSGFQNFPRWVVAALMLLSCVDAARSAPAAKPTARPFVVQDQFVLGGSGGWDYLTIDSAAKRLFVTRSDRVLVINTSDGSLAATIPDTQGVHGIALAPQLGMGFTSNGRSNTVTVFDLKSLKPYHVIAVNGQNPDAILYDSASGHVYTFNGRSQDISVIDPAQAKVIELLPAGGKPEFAVANGSGRIFFNIEDVSQLGVIDSTTSKVIAKWPLPNCQEPTGLATDNARRRLFSVCANGVLVVTDADSGRPVAEVPIGKGPDAAAFDADRRLVFSSNGQDGTLTAIREDDADHFSVIATVVTQKSARTMALDPRTHRIYLAAAQFAAAPAPSADQPHPRPAVVEGSFRVLVVGN